MPRLWIWKQAGLESVRQVMACGGRESISDPCLGMCVLQGAAVTVGVLYQHVCKCMVVSVWAQALVFTYGTNKAINSIFPLNNSSENVIIQPKAFFAI